MKKLKKKHRVAAILKVLTDNPNKIYKLSYFCKEFLAAKSSISEDISVAKEVVSHLGEGEIKTISGADGGVVYAPSLSSVQKESLKIELIEKLNDPSRFLGGGFIYTSDIMFNPYYINRLAAFFADHFKNSGADCVATLETKGIPLAFMTAKLLNIPTIVLRRESRISEGPTVSINYLSGSSERIQKMSISKKAVEGHKSALIIDDFMRAGGSLKGIEEMLLEFSVKVVGIGVAIATIEPEKKKVSEYISFIYYDDKSDSSIKILSSK